MYLGYIVGLTKTLKVGNFYHTGRIKKTEQIRNRSQAL